MLLLIAGSTQKELAAQIRYLKVENEVLRSKLPRRISVTAQEKNRLVKFGGKLGQAVHEIVTIVAPSTILRWIRESKTPVGVKQVRKGRPRTKEEIRELIIRFARENDWGYTRIMGELKKLGIKPPSRNTVKNILKENGLEPGPERGEGTWDEFLKMHAATLWQCDFCAKRVLTLKGWRDLYLLIFLHVESRQVYIAPSTFHPNEEWVVGQAKAFQEHAKSEGLAVGTLMRDRDTKFQPAFDAVIESAGAEVKVGAFRSPNTNAFVERFIQTIQQECLDHFVVFGEQHMDHLVKEFVEFYHEERPHQGKENELLTSNDESQPECPLDRFYQLSRQWAGHSVAAHIILPIAATTA
ncbi:integrase core domain-containing protein [Blastopirellula sp. J2-11]|uniref:integrase core domain-containing protein n=1 Tax=Blastopirellula sp. J2-11 TaxID=2943192 RepID=UPI0021C7AA51|nr:integrase core domain-containing protein [Blastopirellula sp. J2-11]UUO05345.1 integrase core domain-containing protein [Blastopirellula sp. J2-11]